MRLVGKLLVFAVAVFAGLTLTVNAASAQIVVVEEHLDPGDNEPCLPLVKIVHVVTGGCHFELQTEHHLALVAQTAGGPITLGNCNVHIEGRASGNGVGWITEMQLTAEDPPTAPSCTRAACDEANGTQIPWPIALSEVSAGVETVELAFCLRSGSSAPGAPGSTCEMHMSLSDTTEHQYEIGDSTAYTCENIPSVSLHNVHCVNEVQGIGDTKEDVEVIH